MSTFITKDLINRRLNLNNSNERVITCKNGLLIYLFFFKNFSGGEAFKFINSTKYDSKELGHP